jgi:hypothetical protein
MQNLKMIRSDLIMMKTLIVTLMAEPTPSEQALAILIVIIMCIALLLFGGLCFSYGLKLITKSAYKMVKQAEKEEAKRKRHYETLRSDTTKLWLCPICGYWRENPELHLKTYHRVSDDMLEFWIEKGRWV